jgi:general secretion pathway protein L
MRIVAIWKRWIEVLATLFLSWRDSGRERRSLIVTRENGHIVVRRAEPTRDAMLRDAQAGNILATLTPGTEISEDIRRAAHNSFVVLEFPPDMVFVRRITVPAQARKFLAGVIRNQIERLSPWPANDVVYGFAAEAGTADAAAVGVRIVMASRSDVDAAREDLAALGLPVDRIVVRDADSEAVVVEVGGVRLDEVAGSVTLWSRLGDPSRDSVGLVARKFGIGIAASMTVSVALSLWALASATSIRDESEGMAARSKVLQKQVQTGRTVSSLASMPLAERAWASKEMSASSVIMMEALSRALPESAYVTEIRLEKDNLRIIGLAEDAPGLLAPLEKSKHMTDVRFFAPTARGPDGKRFRFSIEARIQQQIKIGED